MNILNAARQAYRAYHSADITIGNDTLNIELVDGITYYAFRGTDDGSDWFENLAVRKTGPNYPVPGAHIGFYHSATDFAAELHSIPDDGNVVVTGHSKGGGIAQLFAEINNLPCIVFASPKVGFQGKRVVEITRDGDWVPLLPFSYRRNRHDQHLHIVRPTLEVIRNPSTSRLLSGIVKSTLRHIGKHGLSALDAHSMANYLNDIELIEGVI